MINTDIHKIQIKRHEKIERLGMQFAEVLCGEEKKTVMSIVKKSKEHVNDLAENENVVYSPTSTEWGQFRGSVKKYVRTDFIKPALKRLKVVSQELKDIEGICNKCIRNERMVHLGEYDMCDACYKKLSFRSEIFWVQYQREKMIEEDFFKAIEETNFSDDLIGNWMLLMRKMRDGKETKHIDNILKEFIRGELINEFSNQNKQLIKKYELWQNQ